ncbi:MAG: ATP-binding protein [Caulobacter sp.]|nr:ATP-binding protein [Caulobacter sp.]
MQFVKAERHKARLRLGITGPSGSGKTWGALQIAKGIGGRIAVIDTERGSASLYTHLVDFDVLELAPPFTPERFTQALQAAEAAGYDVLIMDSITPEWNGVGGCLELVDNLASAKFKGNSWSAWNEVTPRHRAFLDSLLRCNMHVIATMRSKTETAQTEEGGRKKVVKLGMKSEQRDGVEYEFTTVLDLVHDGHYAMPSKDRTGLFRGDPKTLSEETGRILLEWLESGAEPIPSAADFAIKALRSYESDKEGFSKVWTENKANWKAVMSEGDYKRVVLTMQDIAGKWVVNEDARDQLGEGHDAYEDGKAA